MRVDKLLCEVGESNGTQYLVDIYRGLLIIMTESSISYMIHGQTNSIIISYHYNKIVCTLYIVKKI